jgi:hypothetical protein
MLGYVGWEISDGLLRGFFKIFGADSFFPSKSGAKFEGGNYAF